MKYKVVCNRQNCWTRTYDDLNTAKIAAANHKKRLGHNPVYIFEIEDKVALTSSELIAINKIDLSAGIANIHRV